MKSEHEFRRAIAFDVYELHLFELVADCGSFTKAANQVGLTQSAITRQIQSIENQLEVKLFERTTRSVKLTPAGEFLYKHSGSILRDVSQTIQQMREEFVGARRSVSVGVSRSVGLAYLPGFFVAFRKKFPAIRTQVVQQTSGEILAALEESKLQVGVMCPPSRLPSGLKITHRFADDFALITPPGVDLPERSATDGCEFLGKMAIRDWLLLDETSNTGRLLRAWLAKLDVEIKPIMEADTFDLLINLVSMGMGLSIVPYRALALYPRARKIRRIPLNPKFSRELVVVVRKDRKPPEHVTQFIENILF